MLTSRNIIATLLVLVILLPMSLPVGKAQIDVTIGVIAASDDNLASKSVIAKIAMDDLHLAYPSYVFSTSIKSAEGDEVPGHTHLDMVKELQNEGVRLINGGEWSSQAAGSLQYCTDNNILLLSASSTSPALAIAGDNLFRLCPSDAYSAPSIAHMIWSYGYKYTIIIYRGDTWGDGIVDAFKPEYKSLGGTTLGDSSTRYPPNAMDFTQYLKAAENQMKAAQKKYKTDSICVLLIAFNEAAQIISQAEDYPNICGVKWFGADGTAENWDVMHYVPDQASHLRLFSTLPVTVKGPNWDSVASRYAALMSGQSFNSYNANDYDIYWILALSIMEAGSTDAMLVKAKIPEVAAAYNGVSGNCELNLYGDRPNRGFDIWGYGTVEGTIPILNYGSMLARIGARAIVYGSIDTSYAVTWDPSAKRLIGYAAGSVDKYSNAYSAKILNGKWDLTVDDSSIKFTLTYSEKNLNLIEDSPVGSVDYFYVSSNSENIVSQTSSQIVIQCNLHFQKDWAKIGGGRQWTEFDLPATITVKKNSINIDLPLILGQNFDILGNTRTFDFK